MEAISDITVTDYVVDNAYSHALHTLKLEGITETITKQNIKHAIQSIIAVDGRYNYRVPTFFVDRDVSRYVAGTKPKLYLTHGFGSKRISVQIPYV